jgi:hypothetical protein
LRWAFNIVIVLPACCADGASFCFIAKVLCCFPHLLYDMRNFLHRAGSSTHLGCQFAKKIGARIIFPGFLLPLGQSRKAWRWNPET